MNGGLKFRKGDLLAAALVLLLAAACLLALPGLSGGDYAEVYQNGKLIYKVPLSVDQSFPVTGDYTNTVTVRDGAIAVTASDCPTNDCVHQGWLSGGGTIVCLPNGVEIRLADSDGVDAVSP